MEQENEIICTSRSANSSLEKALNALKNTRLGRNLWGRAIESLNMGTLLSVDIIFRSTKSIPSNSMLYEGRGIIWYNVISENSLDFAQLAFHELFHVFQYGMEPLRILDNEIEAYLAQYIFLANEKQKKNFRAATPELTQCIINLAACIDLNTGNIISDKYEECYWAAMRAIKKHPAYQGTEEEPWGEFWSSDMPNLRNFLKNMK